MGGDGGAARARRWPGRGPGLRGTAGAHADLRSMSWRSSSPTWARSTLRRRGDMQAVVSGEARARCSTWWIGHWATGRAGGALGAGRTCCPSVAGKARPWPILAMIARQRGGMAGRALHSADCPRTRSVCRGLGRESCLRSTTSSRQPRAAAPGAQYAEQARNFSDVQLVRALAKVYERTWPSRARPRTDGRPAWPLETLIVASAGCDRLLGPRRACGGAASERRRFHELLRHDLSLLAPILFAGITGVAALLGFRRCCVPAALRGRA